MVNQSLYHEWKTKVFYKNLIILKFLFRLAWEMQINMETSNESINILQLIANDCYKMG